MHKSSFLISLIISCFLCLNLSWGQSTNKNILKPIGLNKSALSGVGLKKIDLKNEPDKGFYQKQLLRGKDISVYVVSTENWVNKIKDFSFDEFVFMLNGEAIVKPQNGNAQLFYTGDYFFAPKGFSGIWEIRAGSNLHYELSIISTQRADSIHTSKNLFHSLFDRSILSGSSIHLDEQGLYQKVLRKGVELTVTLMGERPRAYGLNQPEKEKLIHILSGQLTLTDLENVEHNFYTGDFLVLPGGFKGHWKSEGHGLLKYITVEKTTHNK